MFRVGQTGTPGIGVTMAIIIGGAYSGSNIDVTGTSFLNVDHCRGIIVSGALISRYQFGIVVTANTHDDAVHFNGGTMDSVVTAVSGPTGKICGFWPNANTEDANYGYDGRCDRIQVKTDVSAARVVTPALTSLAGYVAPDTDATIYLGLGNLQWRTLYTKNAIIDGLEVSKVSLVPGAEDLLRFAPRKLLASLVCDQVTHIMEAGQVQQWVDLSPYASPMVQATAARQPLRAQAGNDWSISCTTASDQYLAGSVPSGMNGAAGWTMVVACTIPAAGVGYVIGSSDDAAHGYALVHGSGGAGTGVFSFSDGAVVVTPGDTSLHLYILVYDGTLALANRLVVYVDDSTVPVASFAGPTATILNPGANEYLGTNSANNAPATSLVSLFAHIPYAVSGKDLLQLQAACKAALLVL